MKLTLVLVSLAIPLAQIAPSDAQSISPAGHYTKKRGGPGEMRVQKVGAEWRIFVGAGGYPRPRGLTASDCDLIAVGAIEGDTFQGEVKYSLAPPELKAQRKAMLDYLKGGSSKLSSGIDVEAGVKMTITFTTQSATVNDVDWSAEQDPCTPHTGIFGRYTKDQKRLLTRDCKSRSYNQLFIPACDGVCTCS
jgi:hypothetical protein